MTVGGKEAVAEELRVELRIERRRRGERLDDFIETRLADLYTHKLYSKRFKLSQWYSRKGEW